MKLRILYIVALCVALVSCEKVNPQGIILAGTEVEDRVEMSRLYFDNHLEDIVILLAEGDYSFIVGADSHLTTDSGRLDEMMAIGLENDDLFYAHLGDIADTKAEYYVKLDAICERAKENYVDKYYDQVNDFQYCRKDGKTEVLLQYDEIVFPFFPVVGNHDITRNGWALWTNIFHSSFYEIDVIVDLGNDDYAFDHLIFLDSASGTLGRKQIDLIREGVLDGEDDIYRNTFVFSHTNIFRPQFFEFASTFPREEQFFLLSQFNKWKATAVFCGHVHTWDKRNYNGVDYVTLDTMCERERPEPGDYLVRTTVKSNGDVEYSNVRMNYSPK